MMGMEFETGRGITLSQLQAGIGNAVRMCREAQNVWVQAELSDVRLSGGHCYMELVEKDTAGTTRAKLRAMIWAGTYGRLSAKFREATGSAIDKGMKVLVQGSATHHSLYGLSFNITDIDPSYTSGDMERIRREILARLHREGILEMNRRRTLPVVPQRIAVISSAGAAGYGDFDNQLRSNPEGFVLYPVLFQAVMQGERTAASVIDALDRIEMAPDSWDCVVIIRGGGATTDLNGFDNYELARRVALCPLPVIVGIGHERDRTVLDDIACVRCKTPTAVAAWLVDSLRVAYGTAAELVRRVAQYSAERLKGEHLRLEGYSQGIPALARGAVLRSRLKTTELGHGVERALGRRLEGERANAARLALRLENAAGRRIEAERQRLGRLADLARLLSPENTLRRGYSITRVGGTVVRSASELAAGTRVETQLADGKVTGIIEGETK